MKCKNYALQSKKSKIKREPDSFPGYPKYSPLDDIYARNKEEDLDPENISNDQRSGQIPGRQTKNDSGQAFSEELDVPGSELDDEEENIGNEDEENNYYSLGGDNHNTLEEDNTI